MDKIDLCFATGNPAKFAQLQYVIRWLDAPVTLINLREQFGDEAIYDETGCSSAQVSRQGAQQLASRLGIPVVTEDTSFYVDALNGQPGLKAGQYLREKGRKGILKALSANVRRQARIVSSVSWAAPDGSTQTWNEALLGTVAIRERYRAGSPDWIAPTSENPFGGGYNAIFVPMGLNFTLAEISPAVSMQYGYREPNFCGLILFLIKHASCNGRS